jgi:FAD/FMN-containing dehydrogenase
MFNILVSDRFAPGGISYLSPQVGFGSDTVVNFEVVLSTGEIVNANASSNPDLHLALRGGQNNFGVVTRVDISTFPLGKVHGGTILQNVSTVSGQLKTLHQFAADTDYDEKSNIIQSFGFDGQRVVVVNTLVYMHATPVLPATLQQFVDLGEPISNSIRTASLSELMGDTGTGPVKASR